MFELAQSFGFTLTDALSGYIEFPADFFQGFGLAVLQTKTHSKHHFLSCA